MAKEIVKTPLKKGKATFNLIGKAKITDYTFSLDKTYDSGWTSNEMNIGIDCGNGNIVYAEMSGGYFPNKDNQIYVHGIKEEDGKKQDDYDNRFTIPWEDRFDEDVTEAVANSCFITVGIEKDDKDKTYNKSFLSTYDAVKYISEHLSNDTVVNVKGDIAYESNGDNVYIKKKITSIYLSKSEPDKFKSVFTQTILLDDKSIGKVDKEKNTIEMSAYCVDYIGKPKINGKKIEVKKNFCFPVNFEFEIPEETEMLKKQLSKYFKAKKNEIIELTVEGNIIEGASVVNVTLNDIPEEIRELVEYGLWTEEDALAKCVGNSNREKRMIIVKPSISFATNGEDRIPIVQIDRTKYTPEDLEFYSAYLENLQTDNGVVDTDTEIDEDEEDYDFEALINDL